MPPCLPQPSVSCSRCFAGPVRAPIGLAAAVPISSVPALFWLSLEHGGAYATSAVLGTLWGTGLTVLLGASFARMALGIASGAGAGLLAWLAIGGAGGGDLVAAIGPGRGRGR